MNSFWFAGFAWQLEQDDTGKWVAITIGHPPMLATTTRHRITLLESGADESPVERAKALIRQNGCAAGSCDCHRA